MTDLLDFPPVFWEIHEGLPRQGPGSNEYTRRAFNEIPTLDIPHILDIGCGPGMQTLELARISDGDIVAVDVVDSFLEQLNESAKKEGFSERIRTKNMSMTDLCFPDETFDILWSEGAAYIMGFDAALKEWKRLLKPDGYLAVTEVSWLKDNPPKEILGWWMAQYPAIATVEDNKKRIQESGYDIVKSFPLPANTWWDDYYSLIEKRLPALKEKYSEDTQSCEFIASEEEEMDMHKNFFGVVRICFLCNAEEDSKRPGSRQRNSVLGHLLRETQCAFYILFSPLIPCVGWLYFWSWWLLQAALRILPFPRPWTKAIHRCVVR